MKPILELDHLQKQSFIDHLRRIFPDGLSCSQCRTKGKMRVDATVYDLQPSGQHRAGDGDAYPVLVAQCRHCGHVSLFSAEHAGISR